MNKIYILNALSINMNGGKAAAVVQLPVSLEEAKRIAASGEINSFVGHPDTARVVSGLLEKEVPANRGNFIWPMVESTDSVIVAQYTGPRLPEGATTLPEGAQINFWAVRPLQDEAALDRVLETLRP